MMRSPIPALIWELWRRGQRLAWISAVIAMGCSLSARFIDKSRSLDFEGIYYLLMAASLALVFAIFHQAESNPGKNWHGFPYRQFTLPVPTWILVCCPMALGVVTVELTYLAWAKFVFDTMGDRISLWPAAVLASALPCYQALVWSLAGFRITRIIVLALAGMVFLNIAMIPAFPALQPWPLEKTCAVFVWVLAGLGLGAILGGWFAVERQRRGGGRGRGWLQAQWGRMVDALPRRRKEFASKESAQFWYEWRRSGLLLPVCTLAAPVLIFTPVSWFTRHDADETMLTLAWTLALPVILAAIIGQGFSKPEFWSGNISLAPFVAVHPLANGDFVVAKMRVALLSALLAWLPVLIFLALWLPLWANTVELRKWWDAGVILHGSGIMLVILTLLFISAMILTWRGMVGGLWAGLSGSTGRYAAAVTLQIVAVGIGIWGVLFFGYHFHWNRLEQYVSWLQWALILAVVIKLWLAVYSWRTISPTRAGSYAMLWAVGTAALIALGHLVCPNIFWLKPLVMLAALLPFPLARLGFAPGSLARNRHKP
jgi:hypothetical protein